jgi:hypothetical protein
LRIAKRIALITPYNLKPCLILAELLFTFCSLYEKTFIQFSFAATSSS